MEDKASIAAGDGGILFIRSILTYLLGLGLGGVLQVILTAVSIAVGLMAFKHYRLSIELKQMELAREKQKQTEEENKPHLKVV